MKYILLIVSVNADQRRRCLCTFADVVVCFGCVGLGWPVDRRASRQPVQFVEIGEKYAAVKLFYGNRHEGQ